jgi:hypothetical protein
LGTSPRFRPQCNIKCNIIRLRLYFSPSGPGLGPGLSVWRSVALPTGGGRSVRRYSRNSRRCRCRAGPGPGRSGAAKHGRVAGLMASKSAHRRTRLIGLIALMEAISRAGLRSRVQFTLGCPFAIAVTCGGNIHLQRVHEVFGIRWLIAGGESAQAPEMASFAVRCSRLPFGRPAPDLAPPCSIRYLLHRQLGAGVLKWSSASCAMLGSSRTTRPLRKWRRLRCPTPRRGWPAPRSCRKMRSMSCRSMICSGFSLWQRRRGGATSGH